MSPPSIYPSAEVLDRLIMITRATRLTTESIIIHDFTMTSKSNVWKRSKATVSYGIEVLIN